MSPPDAVVVIPGFKGSALADARSGRRVWVTARAALVRGGASLALDRPDLGVPNRLALVPDGLLERVPVLPGFAIDIYHRWLALLRERLPETRVVPFDYDWRADLGATVGRLAMLVDRLVSDGARRIAIAAHSMGGLVTTHFLRHGRCPGDGDHGRGTAPGADRWPGARHVRRVVLAGVPFRGAAGMFRDLTVGSRTERNRSLLASAALGTFPSSYALLPAPGERFLVAADGGDAADGDGIYDAARWRRERWGLFHDVRGDDGRDAAREVFVARQLARAGELHRALHAPADGPAPEPVRVLHVTGVGRPTRGRVVLPLPRPRGGRADHAPSPWVDGDATVTTASAALPAPLATAFEVDELVTAVEHGDLFADRDLCERMLAFLLVPERRAQRATRAGALSRAG